MNKKAQATNDQLFYRSLELNRSKVNVEERNIDVSFSSEEPLIRPWLGKEILLHGTKNVDLSYLKSMGSTLMNHNPDIIIGPIKNPRIEDKKGKATVIFDDDEDGEKAIKKVNSGRLRGMRVGYIVNKFREVIDDEEYEGIKGPAMVAIKWTPVEISLTPVPADITVGIGRDLTRSLEGIEIEKSNFNLKEEKQMEKEEVQTMIDLAFEKVPETIKGIVPEIVSQVRDALADDVKPKMKIENDIFQDLLGRAGAVSLELKAKVADMAVEGKTEQEITRAILDEAIIEPDAIDKGDLKDGTGLKNKGGDNRPEIITSFEKVEDDDFFRGLSEPIDLPLQ